MSKTKTWNKFIKETVPDKETRKYMQEFFGQRLLGVAAPGITAMIKDDEFPSILKRGQVVIPRSPEMLARTGGRLMKISPFIPAFIKRWIKDQIISIVEQDILNGGRVLDALIERSSKAQLGLHRFIRDNL